MTKVSETAPKAAPLESDWIAAAREMLIEGGVASVQISPLAARLRVTRGGFYWRFRDRQELLECLLADWQATNTRSMLRAVGRSGTPPERYRRLVNLWIDEREFNPALDAAVRAWGAIDPEVRDKVKAADIERIKAISEIFSDTGLKTAYATVRARILYFHQVGYYTLGIKETKSERQALLPIYHDLLTGFPEYSEA